MAEEPKWNPTDAGISYSGSTNAVQKLLNKLKSYKNKSIDKGPDAPDEGSIAGMNAILDDLIQFKDNQAPEISSWNPFTRHRQHKDLEKWVKDRPPSAGITKEDVAALYPENKKETAAIKKGGRIGLGVGAGIGTGIGAAIGALKKGHAPPLPRAIIGGAAGALGGGFTGNVAGEVISGYPYFKKRIKQNEQAWGRMQKAMKGQEAVPIHSIRSNVPKASTYEEVTRELKKQDVGFIKRHGIALLTKPYREGENAAFIPQGTKGLVVASPKVHPAVFKHEVGHAKDYEYYGGRHGFIKAYTGDPKQDPFSREAKIESVMLPEHRAWAYANPRTKKEKQMRKDALTTYRTALDLSSLLDGLIEFGYPKAVIESAQRKWKKPIISIPRKEFKEEHERLLKVLRKKDPSMLNKERAIQAKEMKHELSDATDWNSNMDQVKERAKHEVAKTALEKVEEALKKGRGIRLSEKIDNLINFQDTRPRNQVGEFSPQGEGGPSPNDMATVYKSNQTKTILEGAGAALAGGALGNIGGNIGKTSWAAGRKAIKSLAAKRKAAIKP